MLVKRLISMLISVAILSYSCSGYKEVIRNDKTVGKAKALYLYFDENLYTLNALQEFDNYYLADATLINNTEIREKSVIIYANDINIKSSDQNALSILIEKKQVYKYSKTVRKTEKPLTIIGLVAIAAIIIWVAVDNEENKMKIHAHE